MSYQVISKLDKLTKKQKKEKKAKLNGAMVQRLPLQQLLKNKVMKKLSKDELAQQLIANMGELTKTLGKFFTENKGKIFDDMETVADVFTNERFSKALRNATKDMETIPAEILFTISELHLNTKALKDEEELMERYFKMFAETYEEGMKKVSKTLGIKKVDALLLFVIAQSYKGIPRKILRDRTYKFLEVLYEAAAASDSADEKSIKKVVKALFGRSINNFILYVLLEKASNFNQLKDAGQKEVWGTISTVVLDLLEAMDKDDRKELLKIYAKQRKNNTNVKRRVSLLNGISEDDYKGTVRTVERLISNGMDKELFD